MYPPSPSTPSNSRTRYPAASASAYPRTPYMGTAPLPPSPYTPGQQLPYGGAPGYGMPPTPHMAPTLLPYLTPTTNYGLLTPPATPQRYARVAHPELNPFLASPTYMRWNMGTALPNIPELSNDKLIQAATAPGVTTMRIRHIFFAITFVISAGHALTLGDVLMGLRAELSRPDSRGQTGLQMLQGRVHFGGLMPNDAAADEWILTTN